MPVWMAVALGGAGGSLLRYALNLWSRAAAPGFPWATLAVNVVGSFCIGLIFAATAQRSELPDWIRTGLMTGVIGGFTTFSALSLETLLLWREGQMGLAFANIGANLLLGFSACALGLWLGRSL